MKNYSFSIVVAAIVLMNFAAESSLDKACIPSVFDKDTLKDPCKMDIDDERPPSHYSIVFPTQYGSFKAHCVRERAPVWSDRVYRLAKNGYYNENYFFRVVPGKYVQYGTNGDPSISNVYNYTSTPPTLSKCSIVYPQPPDMKYCLANANYNNSTNDCQDVPALSNTFGTLSMSTSYKDTPDYPNGVTWNATAELFINIGNNTDLDENLFIPICSISNYDMNNVILKFPSFGEVQELGGNGVSLGMLYEYGNSYIESNPIWNASMAITSTVSVCSNDSSDADDNVIAVKNKNDSSSAGRYRSFRWYGRAILIILLYAMLMR